MSAHRKNHDNLMPFLVYLLITFALLGTGCEKIAKDTDLEERADGLIYEIGADEPFTGARTKYHKELEGRRKAFEIHYENGLANGPFKTFYAHGIKEKEGEYSATPETGSLKNGEFISWRKNGTLIYKKTYKNDELHGPYILYHDNWPDEIRKESKVGNQPESDASIEYKVNYINGAADGPYQRFQKSGSLFESGSYKEGVFDGEQIFYYPEISLLAIKDHNGFFKPARFLASQEGFDEATAFALSMSASMPLSRNPKNIPMLVAGLDADGNFLTIVWNTNQDEKTSWSELATPRPKFHRKWHLGKVVKTKWFDSKNPDKERFLFRGAETSAIAGP